MEREEQKLDILEQPYNQKCPQTYDVPCGQNGH